MSIRVWMAGQYDNTHENRMVGEAIETLKTALADTEIIYHIVCCFSVPGFSSRYRSSIDLAVIKPGGMIIVEMKDYTGPIDYGDKGEWYCELLSGGIKTIRGGNNDRSPFRQVSDYRQQCRRLIEKQQLSILLPEESGKRQFNARNWVSTFVLFPNVPDGTRPDTSTFEQHCDKWFHLVRTDRFSEAIIQQMSGRNNWLSNEEVEKLIATVLQAKPARLIGNTPAMCRDTKKNDSNQESISQDVSTDVPGVYNDLARIHSSGMSAETKGLALRDIFMQIANKYAMEKAPNVTFTSLMTKIQYLCDSNMELYRHVDQFRYRSNALAKGTITFSDGEYKEGFRAVCEFAEMLLLLPLPSILADWVASIEYRKSFVESIDEREKISLKIVVEEYGKQYVIGRDIELGVLAKKIRLDLSKSGEANDDLHHLLYENAVLLLVTPKKVDEHNWIASEVVLEPDRLLSPSTLGALTEFANPGLRYILTLFENTDDRQKYYLRGNLANQFLSDSISSTNISHDNSCKNFFRKNALSLTTACLSQKWRAEAMANYTNIKQIINREIPKTYGVCPDDWLIETPFVSPTLGLSGRMDLIHFDSEKNSSMVFELKSGKCNTFRGVHERTAHRVQCAFYGDMLFSMIGIRRDKTTVLIFYAANMREWQHEHDTRGKLFHSTFTRAEIRKDIQLRNHVIDAENRVLNSSLREMIESAIPEIFRLPDTNDRFWLEYQRPEIFETLTPIQNADNLAKVYFYRFVEFLMREDVIARIGGKNLRSAGGYARAWLEGLKDRQLTGSVLWALKINTDTRNEHGLVTALEFSHNNEKSNMGTRIRMGDSVYLYEASDDSRNIANSLLFSGYVEAINAKKIVFVLDNPQQEKFFRRTSKYAIESTFVSGKSGYKGVFALLTGNERRRDLVLGRKKPRQNREAKLLIENASEEPEMIDLLLRINQAQDYFVLHGPPGTGKTSYAIKLILDEAMCNPNANILLLAYTHRALDEVCKMLEARNPCDAYLRIGSQTKCNEKYRNRLLQNQEYSNRDDVREKIDGIRIFVGTISSITATHDIFKLKTFSLAILDEASQVLEPQILSVFCGQRPTGELLVDKFVFVGDDKQLPAVVQQTHNESAVSENCLRNIGLTNCRHSIFQRLRKINNDNRAVVGHLRRHWRMHPLISDFCNKHFYGGILVDGGSAHQNQEHPYPNLDVAKLSGLEKVVATHRLALFPVFKDNLSESDKVNRNEAKRVAQIIHILKHICGRKAKDIGVIVPFRNQISAIYHALMEVDPGAPDWSNGVVIDSIERYQGSERDVILFSTVISKEYQCELLSETEDDGDPDGDERISVDRRLNVAVSRAKEQFFVIGDPSILSSIRMYDKLMEWLQKKGMVWSDE